MSITSFVDFEHIPVVGMLLDLDGTVLAVNEATRRLLGKTEAELIGKRLDQLMSASLSKYMTSGHMQRALVDELELDGPNGVCTIEIVMSMIDAGGRQILQVYGVDVTARKAAERAARERAEIEAATSAKQRAESLGIVAGGIAHDFNNLLVGVMAEASSAREDPSMSPAIHEALRRIEAGARKMSQLTRSMLAYAGRGRVDTARIDPDGLLDELRPSLGRLVGGRKLVVTPGAGSVAVEADSNLVRQAIGNLLANAVEANGTRVEISSRIVMRQNAEWWQLEVADDGEGIAAAALPHIFEPFFTTRKDQTGLGLSAVQGIVRRLGGDIEVDSRPGHGARFRLCLPVLAGAQAPARRSTTQGMAPVARLSGLRVLIADDEPSVRSTVRRLLERRGATVEVAVDGTEAERKLDGSFGLAIFDVMMPGRTGYDVLASARRRFPDLPVIIMSGYTEHTRGAGGEAPDAFLEKPFTARALDALIDQVMRAAAVAQRERNQILPQGSK